MFRWICSLFFCIGLQAQSVKTFDHTCADGKVRPYVVYSPEGESKAPKPLLVFLHGAISSRLIPRSMYRNHRSCHWPMLRVVMCFFPLDSRGLLGLIMLGSRW